MKQFMKYEPYVFAQKCNYCLQLSRYVWSFYSFYFTILLSKEYLYYDAARYKEQPPKHAPKFTIFLKIYFLYIFIHFWAQNIKSMAEQYYDLFLILFLLQYILFLQDCCNIWENFFLQYVCTFVFYSLRLFGLQCSLKLEFNNLKNIC